MITRVGVSLLPVVGSVEIRLRRRDIYVTSEAAVMNVMKNGVR